MHERGHDSVNPLSMTVNKMQIKGNINSQVNKIYKSRRK